MKNFSLCTMILCALTAVALQGCATAPENKPPEELYQEGEQSFQQSKYNEAVTSWKKVKESYKSAELTIKAEIGIADAQYLDQNYIEAAASYEDFRKLHPKHALADYALYRQGLSYFKQINRIETDQTPVRNARAMFESYAKSYPAGAYIKDAQQKISDCRSNQLQYEIYVGHFYLKMEKYPAAIARFEEALKNFPGLLHTDELLYYLGTAYGGSGQKEKCRETFDRLAREFPGSSYLAEVRKSADK